MQMVVVTGEMRDVCDVPIVKENSAYRQDPVMADPLHQFPSQIARVRGIMNRHRPFRLVVSNGTYVDVCAVPMCMVRVLETPTPL